MSKFITVTRIYKEKDSGNKKEQPMVVSVASIATVRPSNRLGYPEHRSTITLTSGAVIDLADKYSEVRAAVGA